MTVTPFPTLTPFPTPAGTPMLDLAPILQQLEAGSLGPNAVQWWQMSFAPHWGPFSLALEIMLVLGMFMIFYIRFRDS